MQISTESEKKILEAARREFETKGYNGTRMQKIADLAGISKASLHYYYRSKDNLFQKIFNEALDKYLPVLNTWADDRLNWEQKLQRYTNEMMEFIQNGSLLFIIREVNRNPDLLTERIKQAKSNNKFVCYFEKMQTEKQIKKTDPNLLYIMLQSVCFFPALNKQSFKKILRLSEKQYEELMQSYAVTVADFFITALKKK